MKFIADVMLGKLARYLRVAGNDVIYINSITDEKIIEIARDESRILLTRDKLMLQRRDCKNKVIKSIFVNDDMLDMQLRQVKDELAINIKPDLKRCIECNLPLEEVKKEKASGKVPPYVYKTQDHFLFCGGCNRFYWRGTHYKNIENFFKILNQP